MIEQPFGMTYTQYLNSNSTHVLSYQAYLEIRTMGLEAEAQMLRQILGRYCQDDPDLKRQIAGRELSGNADMLEQELITAHQRIAEAGREIMVLQRDIAALSERVGDTQQLRLNNLTLALHGQGD